MNMYKRIISVVSCVLFSLLALLAAIITDLNDRDFPQAIGSKSRININFHQSDISINEAFIKLTTLDKELNLGLVKVVPNFDNDSEVFVLLNDHALPSEFTWFRGDKTAKIVDKNRLANSYPDGTYLVTHHISGLDELVESLQSIGVEVVRRDASVLESLEFVVMEKGFATAVLASLALVLSLALFWLSIKARSRALRVLSGSPTMRIQMQDLVGFCGALLVSAGIITLISVSYIGIFHGFMHINIYLTALISLQGTVIIFSVLIALIMSAFAWPSTKMFATRQPPVKSLRSVAIILQAVTFLLVITTVIPAWSTYQQSSTLAAEMEQWKKLADQVSIVFATDNNEMEYTESMIGEVIKDAEYKGMVALSYTYTKEMWPSVDFHNYSAVSIVNEQWLDLISVETEKTIVTPVSKHDIPENLLHEIQDELKFLSRQRDSGNFIEQLQFRETIGNTKLPVIAGGGGGSLYFGDDILFIVIPSLYDAYNDANVTSLISGGNVIFTGVTATEDLLKKHQLDLQSLRSKGLKGELHVVHMAEEGMLRAQYTAYLTWLQNLSFITLMIAFTLVTTVHAWISATLKSKRDFPLRLAGKSWMGILKGRILKEFIVGAFLIVIVILLKGTSALGLVLLTAGYGMIIVAISHLIAVSWCFNGVGRRRI